MKFLMFAQTVWGSRGLGGRKIKGIGGGAGGVENLVLGGPICKVVT